MRSSLIPARYNHNHRFNGFFVEAFSTQSLFQTYPKCVSRHNWDTPVIKKRRKKKPKAITVLKKEGGGSGEVWSWSQIHPQPHPLPLLTPPLCQVGWFAKTKNLKKIRKNHWNDKNPKMFRGMPILAIHSLTIGLQSTGKQNIQIWTDRHTTVHGPCVFIQNWPRGPFSETQTG